MNIEPSRLDGDELLHLALNASQKGEPDKAIEYLKHALETSGNHAKVHYLLGAEYAQLGMHDRAAQEMASAIDLDPSLVAARFQLGLLHLTNARLSEAVSVWEPLENLGENNPFFLFKSGLIHLANDEFDECLTYLRKGLSVNTSNPALNHDMQMIIDQVTSSQNPSAPETVENHDANQPASGHVFISAYTATNS